MSLGVECTYTLYSFICHYCVPFLLTDDNMLTYDNLFTQDNLLTQDKFQCCHLPLPQVPRHHTEPLVFLCHRLPDVLYHHQVAE